MFGTLATDKDEIEETRQGMTLGLLTSTMRYLALKDMSLFDDISISDAIIASRILEKRIPLQSTYNASTPTDTESKSGRPKSEDNPTSDGNEQDQDSAVQTKFN